MSDVPWFISVFVAFLPFLIFCAAALWHARQMRRCMTTRDGRSLAEVFSTLAHELKRANDAIAAREPGNG